MTTMTDARTVEVLSAMRDDGGAVADADYTAAIDHVIARLREPAGVGAFDEAVAAELPRVSHIEYDSHEICKHFASKVRERLAAAPQPPAEAQAQGGGDVYGYEHDGRYWPRDGATPWVIHHAVPLYTAPPSAPVEVEAADIADRLRNIASIMRGFGGTERIDDKAWERVMELADRVDSLAQQPAAVDGAMVERVAFAIHQAMKPSNLTDSDWTSGAVLGFENSYRDMVMQAARAALAAQPGGSDNDR